MASWQVIEMCLCQTWQEHVCWTSWHLQTQPPVGICTLQNPPHLLKLQKQLLLLRRLELVSTSSSRHRGGEVPTKFFYWDQRSTIRAENSLLVLLSENKGQNTCVRICVYVRIWYHTTTYYMLPLPCTLHKHWLG